MFKSNLELSIKNALEPQHNLIIQTSASTDFQHIFLNFILNIST